MQQCQSKVGWSVHCAKHEVRVMARVDEGHLGLIEPPEGDCHPVAHPDQVVLDCWVGQLLHVILRNHPHTHMLTTHAS